MNLRVLTKLILQKAIDPFLSERMPQNRVVIFHDILPAAEEQFKKIIAWFDQAPQLQATLTFDDGFYSSYQAIKNLRNRKATFFVCPEFINHANDPAIWKEFFRAKLMRKEDFRDPDFCNAVRPASWDNLRELVRLGHKIGSHTLTHARLSKVTSAKELEREIIGSAEALEDKLQVPINAFAYPFGDIKSIDERACRIISGRYRYCYTGIRGNNMHHGKMRSFLWRDAISPAWTIDLISFTLRGGFDWYYAKGRRYMQRITT